MLRRHDRDHVFAHIHALLQTVLGDIWEVFHKLVVIAMPDVEVNVVDTVFLHFGVNRTGYNVARASDRRLS
jgi:hypothetical protein